VRPSREQGRRGYRFTGEGSYAEVLPPSMSTLVVTPGGYSEGWSAPLAFGIEGGALAA